MATLNWSECPAVESVPGKVSGAWVFKGTRTPVAVVFEKLEDGMTIDEVMELCPGDAANFVRVLTQELIPDIERRFRTTKPRNFAGHSLGGLFGAYAMLEAPDVFQGLILGSPAFYWDDQVMLKLEAKFAEQKQPCPPPSFSPLVHWRRRRAGDSTRLAQELADGHRRVCFPGRLRAWIADAVAPIASAAQSRRQQRPTRLKHGGNRWRIESGWLQARRAASARRSPKRFLRPATR